MPGRAAGHEGAGLLSTVAGVLVFLAFLLFAVEILFGLYASSTVTAVANDAALRAAADGAPPLEVIEADARRNLGRVGETAEFDWGLADTDDDGDDDTVVLRVVTRPPRFLPPGLGGVVGRGEVRRTARARIEEVQS